MNNPAGRGSCEGMDPDGYILLNDLTGKLFREFQRKALVDKFSSIGIEAHLISDTASYIILSVKIDGKWCYLYSNHTNYSKPVFLLMNDTPLPEDMIQKAIALLKAILPNQQDAWTLPVVKTAKALNQTLEVTRKRVEVAKGAEGGQDNAPAPKPAADVRVETQMNRDNEVMAVGATIRPKLNLDELDIFDDGELGNQNFHKGDSDAYAQVFFKRIEGNRMEVTVLANPGKLTRGDVKRAWEIYLKRAKAKKNARQFNGFKKCR